jgi:predicted small lipoprotein YifL
MRSGVNKVLCLMCLIVLTGCGDKKPANSLEGADQNAPQPVAAQEREIQQRLEAQKKELEDQQREAASRAGRMQYVEPLLDMSGRWNSLRQAIAYPNPNSNTRELLERMEAVKKEVEAASTDSCTSPVKAALLEHMGLIIAIVGKLGETSNSKIDAAMQKDVDRANELQGQVDTQLRACAN